MSSLAILGATGNLGRHVARQAISRGLDVSVAVRSRNRLLPDIATSSRVTDLDLAAAPAGAIASFAQGSDALVFCAGVVTEGERFVSLFDRVVTALEAIDPARRPVSWFLAGAALLPLDRSGRRGVDLPKVRDTYWPHLANYERLLRSDLDWRLLCPGPMVEQPALGQERLRVSVEALPAPLPSFAGALPGLLLLPFFALKVPEMIVPYADAADVMLENLGRAGPMSRKRVGIALPVGMKGKKDEWAARAKNAP